MVDNAFTGFAKMIVVEKGLDGSVPGSKKSATSMKTIRVRRGTARDQRVRSSDDRHGQHAVEHMVISSLFVQAMKLRGDEVGMMRCGRPVQGGRARIPASLLRVRRISGSLN